MAATDYSHTLGTHQSGGLQRNQSRYSNALHVDWLLLTLLIILMGAGLLLLYSGSGQDIGMVKRQAIHFAVGFLGLFVIAQFPPRFYQRLAPWAYLGGGGLLLAVLFFGVGAKGAQRWLDLPGLPRFQPSELMKLALPMAVAWYFANCPTPPKLRHLLIALVIVLVPTVLILRQPDLGTSLLIGTSGLLVLFFAGMSWRIIFSMLTLAGSLLPVAWLFLLRDYQKQRVLTFLNPESDPLGSGWNIIQSKTAIGSGGVQGKGFLQGTQAHLEFLPESHTDFIVAVLAEEFGLVGVVFLLSLYLLIILRSLLLASRCETLFGRLLSGSLATTFFIYVFVNVGMVSGILPVVGVPLPLVSYGGTSVVSLLLAFGLLMSMSTHRQKT